MSMLFEHALGEIIRQRNLVQIDGEIGGVKPCRNPYRTHVLVIAPANLARWMCYGNEHLDMESLREREADCTRKPIDPHRFPLLISSSSGGYGECGGRELRGWDPVYSPKKHIAGRVLGIEYGVGGFVDIHDIHDEFRIWVIRVGIVLTQMWHMDIEPGHYVMVTYHCRPTPVHWRRLDHYRERRGAGGIEVYTVSGHGGPPRRILEGWNSG